MIWPKARKNRKRFKKRKKKGEESTENYRNSRNWSWKGLERNYRNARKFSCALGWIANPTELKDWFDYEKLRELWEFLFNLFASEMRISFCVIDIERFISRDPAPAPPLPGAGSEITLSRVTPMMIGGEWDYSSESLSERTFIQCPATTLRALKATAVPSPSVQNQSEMGQRVGVLSA